MGFLRLFFRKDIFAVQVHCYNDANRTGGRENRPDKPLDSNKTGGKNDERANEDLRWQVWFAKKVDIIQKRNRIPPTVYSRCTQKHRAGCSKNLAAAGICRGRGDRLCAERCAGCSFYGSPYRGDHLLRVSGRSVPRGKGAIVCMKPKVGVIDRDNYIVPIWTI